MGSINIAHCSKQRHQSIFRESNPGQLGEKRECYLCATPPPSRKQICKCRRPESFFAWSIEIHWRQEGCNQRRSQIELGAALQRFWMIEFWFRKCVSDSSSFCNFRKVEPLQKFSTSDMVQNMREIEKVLVRVRVWACECVQACVCASECVWVSEI